MSVYPLRYDPWGIPAITGSQSNNRAYVAYLDSLTLSLKECAHPSNNNIERRSRQTPIYRIAILVLPRAAMSTLQPPSSLPLIADLLSCWCHHHHHRQPWAQRPLVSDAIVIIAAHRCLSRAAWLNSCRVAPHHCSMSSDHSRWGRPLSFEPSIIQLAKRFCFWIARCLISCTDVAQWWHNKTFIVHWWKNFKSRSVLVQVMTNTQWSSSFPHY